MTGTLRRRLVTIPRIFVAFAVVSALFPALVVVAALADAVRPRARAALLRLTAFLWVFLFAETVGLVRLGWIGLVSRGADLVERTYRVQEWWTGFLFGAVCWLFRLGVALDGEAAIEPGPVLVLVRHTSIIDTLLPSVFVTARHSIRLRFVLKRELLADPCLDVAGHRLPNHFVARDSNESAAEIAQVRALAAGLTAREGVLIYPEGTRFTQAKRDRALEKLRASDAQLADRAAALTHVLPPRLGGVLALLDGETAMDVLVFAHSGLEGFANVRDLVGGGLVGRTLRMRVTRIPRSAIPDGREARIAWLYDQWTALDRWVADQR